MASATCSSSVSELRLERERFLACEDFICSSLARNALNCRRENSVIVGSTTCLGVSVDALSMAHSAAPFSASARANDDGVAGASTASLGFFLLAAAAAAAVAATGAAEQATAGAAEATVVEEACAALPLGLRLR